MAYGDKNYRPSFFGGFSFFPPVIKNLLIINGAVFLVQIFLQGFTFTDSFGQQVSVSNILTEYFALIPLGYGFLPWQLISFQFMHASFTHILFNMLYLWMFGMELENAWGSKKFLIYYLTCGIGAGLTQLFGPIILPLFYSLLDVVGITSLLGLSPFNLSVGPTVGASGGVYGVLMAFALMFPNRPIYLYFFIPIPAKYLIGFMILIEFFSVGDKSFTAHLAHIGGAVIGVIFYLIDKRSSLSVTDYINKFKKLDKNRFGFNKPQKEVSDVQYYDINEKTGTINQEEIDKILDKISKSGYQNLTEKEKQILFDASKKL
ncbi:MAG: rhomboid family intramembrane serine protease [Bacteroidetes bacterium]|nr:rhomboid family intramembrane serine protease [Bacteroidota bacterium]MBU2586297.1 rhomboid family intramembrane serine protease [Bacteroidota bacterium]